MQKIHLSTTESHSPFAGRKKELRALYKNLRSRLSAEEEENFNASILNCFQENFPLDHISSLHLFLPIRSQKEVNTYPILDYVRKKYPHIQILCSQSNPQTYEMPAFILQEDTPLINNLWGVPEPHNAQAFPHKEIDMVLLPLLVADQKGYRVGYGKGFYDRFLSTCREGVYRVGLSFFPLIPEIMDVEPTDKAMDYCIVRDQLVGF